MQSEVTHGNLYQETVNKLQKPVTTPLIDPCVIWQIGRETNGRVGGRDLYGESANLNQEATGQPNSCE